MKARLARRMFGAAVTPPRIGRYRIERRIGAGGMGVVYEGFDEQLERRVAIKLLHPELGERHAVRMRREGLALGKMSHPNVVHAYEIGVHDGSVFLVMEFIAGEPLSKWQRAHGHLHTAILEKYIEAGRGLAAAHAAGIVHRDFKPSNVVVCEDGPARVLDFGLARGLGAIVDADEPAGALSNPASSLDVRVTVTGTTMGTPAYMSPEQMLGQPTNAASDQFSFCVALYEGLYGERPFLGENATELYESLLSERVRPAPSASRVPTRIRAIVLRGLRARPEDRFPSMQDLLRALEGSTRRGTWRPVVALGSVAVLGTAWFIGTREPACAEGADAAAQVWSQHRPELTAAFADLPHGDTVVAGIDDRITRYAEGWANRYRETCEIQDATARRRALACLDAHRAALQSLTEVLGSGEGGVIDDAFQLVDELPLPTECAETALSPGEGSQRGQLASAKLDAVAGRTEQARATASAILDEARRTQSTALIAEALFTLALIEIEASDHGAATALLGEAVAAGIAADTPLLVSDAWLELARLESGHASTLGASAEHLRNARAMLQRYTGGSDRLPGDRAGRFATIEGEQALEAGDLDAAETKLRAAVEALEAAHDERHKLVTRARLQLAHVLGAKGESQEAIELYATARTAMTDLAGPYYPQLWAFDYGIALVHLDLEEYENARSRLESALRLLGEAGKRWARQRGQILVALSQTYMFLDREDDGLDAARRARAELESAPPDDQTRRGADGMIATLLQGTGDLDGAAEAFRSLAAGQEAANDRRAAAEVRAHLVTMELRRGRPDDAAAVLERHRDAIAERFGVGRVRVLDDLVAAMQALAAGDEASGHAGLERIRDAIAPDEVDGVQWCDVRAWATLALARSLAADDPVRARTLAEEAKAHLTETPHDLGLLAEVDAFLGA